MIEIFSSPNCHACSHAKVLLEEMLITLGEEQINWREVDILKEIDYAVAMGVLSTPAIAFNDKLVFTRIPSSKELHTEIMRILKH